MPGNQKHVVSLQNEDGYERIHMLAQSGMRVVLLDGSLAQSHLRRLREDVLAVFHARNVPLGLMLRLTPQDPAVLLHCYQYILLDGFSGDEAVKQIQRHRPETEAMWLMREPKTLEGLNGLIQGVVTDDAALSAAARGKQLLVATSGNIPADAVIWPAGVQAKELANCKERGWDDEYTHTCREMNAVTGGMTVRYAQSCGAKAIILFTANGENLAGVSCFYPPIPIIAVAKRPEGEAMLLRQTLRWGTLPTAISKVPPSPQIGRAHV